MSVAEVIHPKRPDWQRVHTVLLDMDGTLLDLRFDNYFWMELVPQRWGEARGLSLLEAQTELRPRFAERHGTLQWYCTDFWTRELGFSIAALKAEAREHIRYLPGAEEFLKAVRERVQRVVLATNAHHDALGVKAAHTGLKQHFDQLVSSHQFGHPKEHPAFWSHLRAHLALDPASALFIDDSLPVLRAARAFGIGQVFAVTKPDSTQPVREVAEFPAVGRVSDLLL